MKVLCFKMRGSGSLLRLPFKIRAACSKKSQLILVKVNKAYHFPFPELWFLWLFVPL